MFERDKPGEGIQSPSGGFMPSIGSSNDYGDFTALTARLDTRPVLDDLELWLRGKILRQEIVDGRVEIKTTTIGAPKANDLGIQSILMLASGRFNSQFVQGSWDQQLYDADVKYLRLGIAEILAVNAYKWGIDMEQDYNLLVNILVDLASAFSSRLINDGERKSYAGSIAYMDKPEQKKGGSFSLFSR